MTKCFNIQYIIIIILQSDNKIYTICSITKNGYICILPEATILLVYVCECAYTSLCTNAHIHLKDVNFLNAQFDTEKNEIGGAGGRELFVQNYILVRCSLTNNESAECILQSLTTRATRRAVHTSVVLQHSVV